MKDIRPLLEQLEKILNSGCSAEIISKRIVETVDQPEIRGTILADQLSFMGCWDEGAYFDCKCATCLESFEQERQRSLDLIKVLKKSDWPESEENLVVTYQKPELGFSLAIKANVCGYRVECSENELKKEVEAAISKLNQNQSARNFLFNTVLVLPETYKDYSLVL